MSIKVNTDGSFEVQDIEQALALSERLKLHGAAAGTRLAYPPPIFVPAAPVEAAAARPLRVDGRARSARGELRGHIAQVLELLRSSSPLDNLQVAQKLGRTTGLEKSSTRNALLRLQRQGFLKRDRQGAWSPTSKSSTSTSPSSPRSGSSPSLSPSSMGRSETKMSRAVALIREKGSATLEEVMAHLGEIGPMGHKRTSVLLCALVRSRKLLKGERGTPWTIGPTS